MSTINNNRDLKEKDLDGKSSMRVKSYQPYTNKESQLYYLVNTGVDLTLEHFILNNEGQPMLFNNGTLMYHE